MMNSSCVSKAGAVTVTHPGARPALAGPSFRWLAHPGVQARAARPVASVTSRTSTPSGLFPAAKCAPAQPSSCPRSAPFSTSGRGQVSTQAAAGGAASSSDNNSPQQENSLFWLIGFFVVAGGAIAYLMSDPGAALKEYLVNGPLGKSGFLAAFSLIFLSEIGDKTFFIAALLAMKVGKWMSYFGSVAALVVMTIISVGIGAVFSRVPDALKSSIPVGELAGIALLVFFGVKALRDGLKEEEGGADDELEDAESAVKEAEASGRVKRSSPITTFLEVATLIFLAEWGDRSMLATIALGAAQNPIGVAIGASVGHAIATGIAVLGGAIASKYVSEKTVNIASGVLFLIFAAATAYSMLL